jgi:hypothetical protein
MASILWDAENSSRLSEQNPVEVMAMVKRARAVLYAVRYQSPERAAAVCVAFQKTATAVG